MVTTPTRSDRLDAPRPRDLAGPSASVRAALRDRRPPHARLAQHLVLLARHGGALALRCAMVLAWIKEQDLADLGYPSFAALVTERVDWSESWERGLRRLVCSPLDAVKAALCQGLITVRAAAAAPGRVAVDEQEAWLAEQVLGPARKPDDTPPELEWVEGEGAAIVRRGRRLARLLLGSAASDREIDAHILQWWRERVPAAELLAMALAPREAPPEVELRWECCARDDPAAALLGAWRVPSSLDEAARRLDDVQRILRSRRALLAHGWALFDAQRGWATLGYRSSGEFAAWALDWSPSTAGRYRRLGRRLEWYPAIRRAVREWLRLEWAEALIPLVDGNPRHVDRWVAVLRRVGRGELGRAVRSARDGSPARTLAAYERAIAVADRWDEAEPGAAPSSAGGPPGPLRVALPMREPSPRALRRGLRVPRGLVRAARWLLAHVQVPAQRGFGRVKERDRYRCQNPECGRVGLRCHAHHEKPRCEGGSDDLSNGITLCRVCHLRLVHAHAPDGRPRLTVRSVRVQGLAALLWTWADGRRVLQLREGPGWVRAGPP